MTEETSDNEQEPTTSTEQTKKPPKRGIIYLSTIPPYMNVSKIREFFSEYGTVGRIYLQLADKGNTIDILTCVVINIVYLIY